MGLWGKRGDAKPGEPTLCEMDDDHGLATVIMNGHALCSSCATVAEAELKRAEARKRSNN